jgi:hypothetical protein
MLLSAKKGQRCEYLPEDELRSTFLQKDSQ